MEPTTNAATVGIRPGEFVAILIELLRPSPTNPRKHFDQALIDDLAKNIGEQGVHQPLLVRPWTGKAKADAGAFEIVAGERRYRAAKQAGLAEVPCRVRNLSDSQVLEIQVIENMQRADLSVLEEGDGYQQLMRVGYDVEKIADRVGRSVKYVYDRMKLLQLTKEARQLLESGEITAGHAILLARITPADQARAIGNEDSSPLFVHESHFLTFREEDDENEELPEDPRKAISVRELEAWIDRNVRLEAAKADPMLFPDTVLAVRAAEETNEKVVRITYAPMTPEGLKDGGPRAILGRSWMRADGLRGSKTCDRSVIGVVVIDAGRGETMRVCVDKKGCSVHWSEQQKAAKKRAAVVSKESKTTGVDPETVRRQKEAEAERRRAAEDARWERAKPAIREAIVAAVKKAPTGVSGQLAKMVLDIVREAYYGLNAEVEAAAKLVPGKTADDLVRRIALASVLYAEAEDGLDQFAIVAKSVGVDIVKIRDQVAPEVPEGECRECGCTDDKACKHGNLPCHWTVEPDPKTGLGLCSKCADEMAPAKLGGGRPKKAKAKAKPKAAKAAKPKKSNKAARKKAA